MVTRSTFRMLSGVGKMRKSICCTYRPRFVNFEQNQLALKAVERVVHGLITQVIARLTVLLLQVNRGLRNTRRLVHSSTCRLCRLLHCSLSFSS